MKKSQLVGFMLTFLFGPIGLFYSSAAAALGFLIFALALGFLTLGLGAIGALLMWPVSILVGFATVSRFNARVALEEKRHRELVRAARTGRSRR